jgi:hypothetical protein
MAALPAPVRRDSLNRALVAACAVLLALVAAQYLFILAGVPRFYERVATGQVHTRLFGDDRDISPEIIAAYAAERGLSLPGYAAYFLAQNFAVALGFWVAAGLILWKNGGDWFRWFTAVMLAFVPSGTLFQISIVAFPDISPYVDAIALLWPGLLLFLALFPDGRAVPRWSRWPLGGFALAHLGLQTYGFLVALPGAGTLYSPIALQAFEWVISAAFLFILGCQVYRYGWGAGPVERRQIQWFVAAIGVMLLSSIALEAVGGQAAGSRWAGYIVDADRALFLILPAAIVVSILRYRLWDIDILIRRTLLYAALTGLLALIYYGIVVILQGLVRPAAGQGQWVTVASTLAIAALFVPLRRRVQGFIDRRFYRRRYDAARTLALFGARLRDQVELGQLSEHLVAAVQETMQPAHVSLWVKPLRTPLGLYTGAPDPGDTAA